MNSQTSKLLFSGNAKLKSEDFPSTLNPFTERQLEGDNFPPMINVHHGKLLS